MQHTPVLLKEVISYLALDKNDNVIDCTLGAGGHTQEILKHTAPRGRVLGIDLDHEALETAKKNLKEFEKRVILVQDNFKNLRAIAKREKFNQIKGILIDLGMSSMQIDQEGRGFSFLRDEPLDMRMDTRQAKTAENIINYYSYRNLLRVFQDYGDFSKRQAVQLTKAVLRERKKKKIQNTFEFNQVIIRALLSFKEDRSQRMVNQKEGISKTKIGPVARAFQALRIEVNVELDNLREALPQALEVLEPGGRMVVISFHSGEDRLVKHFFRRCAQRCICPDQAWVCVCQHEPEVKILTKKPILPTEDEMKNNPRSRSAKMRVVEKLG